MIYSDHLQAQINTDNAKALADAAERAERSNRVDALVAQAKAKRRDDHSAAADLLSAAAGMLGRSGTPYAQKVPATWRFLKDLSTLMSLPYDRDEVALVVASRMEDTLGEVHDEVRGQIDLLNSMQDCPEWARLP